LEIIKLGEFEKWYYSEEEERFRGISVFSEFEEVHKKDSIAL